MGIPTILVSINYRWASQTFYHIHIKDFLIGCRVSFSTREVFVVDLFKLLWQHTDSLRVRKFTRKGPQISAYMIVRSIPISEFKFTSWFSVWKEREALRWVHKYIHAFGGDPSRVTMWVLVSLCCILINNDMITTNLEMEVLQVQYLLHTRCWRSEGNTKAFFRLLSLSLDQFFLAHQY